MYYILQREKDTSCEFITILNAFHHRWDAISFGSKYGTQEYYDSYKIFRKNPKKFYDSINLARVEYSGKANNLKKWICDNLKQGNLIDFGAHIRVPHSFLIADYNEKLDSFMCINARVFTNTQAIEWLPFPLLLKVYKQGVKYNNKSFGKLKVDSLHLSSAALVFDKKEKIMEELSNFKDIRAEISQKQFDAICKKYNIIWTELNSYITEANSNVEGLVL